MGVTATTASSEATDSESRVNAVVLSELDNVATVLAAVASGSEIRWLSGGMEAATSDRSQSLGKGVDLNGSGAGGGAQVIPINCHVVVAGPRSSQPGSGSSERDDTGLHTITATSDIPSGHKVAIASIAKGDPIKKYGYTIGRASTEIVMGSHVHTHNLTGQEI